MSKYLRENKTRFYSLVYFAPIFFLLACGGGGGSNSQSTGELSFSVVFKDDVNASLASSRAVFSCEGVEFIEALVLDDDDEVLAVGGPWACAIGQGIVESVPAGTNRIVVVNGLNNEEVLVYSGTSDPVEVLPGQTTNAGLIELEPVLNLPPEFDPINETNTVLVTEPGEIVIVVTATDPNPDDTLTFSADLDGLPAESGAEFDPVTQTFRWDVGFSDNGSYIVIFNVFDNGVPSLGDSLSVVITIAIPG